MTLNPSFIHPFSIFLFSLAAQALSFYVFSLHLEFKILDSNFNSVLNILKKNNVKISRAIYRSMYKSFNIPDEIIFLSSFLKLFPFIVFLISSIFFRDFLIIYDPTNIFLGSTYFTSKNFGIIIFLNTSILAIVSKTETLIKIFLLIFSYLFFLYVTKSAHTYLSLYWLINTLILTLSLYIKNKI